jgi:hypothetical protein
MPRQAISVAVVAIATYTPIQPNWPSARRDVDEGPEQV